MGAGRDSTEVRIRELGNHYDSQLGFYYQLPFLLGFMTEVGVFGSYLCLLRNLLSPVVLSGTQTGIRQFLLLRSINLCLVCDVSPSAR